MTDLKPAVSSLRALGIKGCSVSMPFKQQIVELLDHVDPLARRVGAVNTVLNNEGQLVGYNTDVSGAIKLIGGLGISAGDKVLILGAGVVGVQAAKMAAGLGAHVTIMDISMKRLRYVNDVLPSHVVTDFSSEYSIRKHIQTHDLIIGGVLIKGAKAPKLITREMISTMRPGTVIVDVAVGMRQSVNFFPFPL